MRYVAGAGEQVSGFDHVCLETGLFFNPESFSEAGRLILIVHLVPVLAQDILCP